MAELEQIRRAAFEFYSQAKPKVSTLLWETTQRIVRNSEMIADQPEISDSDIPVDRFSLMCGCYFLLSSEVNIDAKDSGWFNSQPSGKRAAVSAEIAAEHLGGLLQPKKLECVCRIVVESENKRTNLPEAMILSDAALLESMGTMGLINELVRNIDSFKGIEELIQSRRKKEQYCYWDAILENGFHFEMVRRMAAERHEFTASIISKLEDECTAAEIKESANLSV